MEELGGAGEEDSREASWEEWWEWMWMGRPGPWGRGVEQEVRYCKGVLESLIGEIQMKYED